MILSTFASGCWRVLTFSLAVAAVSLVSGCAYSTRPPSLPAHAKTIAIPVFSNKTYLDEYTQRLEVECTEATRTAFLKNGKLKVSGREDADLILEASIIRLERKVIRIDRYGEPVNTQVRILAKASLYDVKAGKYLFEDALVKNDKTKPTSGSYDISRGQYEGLGRQEAVEDLGQAMLQRVFDRW